MCAWRQNPRTPFQDVKIVLFFETFGQHAVFYNIFFLMFACFNKKATPKNGFDDAGKI